MSEFRKGTANDESWHVDWESHRLQQLTAAMDATPAQRLAWLEEMLRLAYRSGALKTAAFSNEERSSFRGQRTHSGRPIADVLSEDRDG